jgi:hypothetical protein
MLDIYLFQALRAHGLPISANNVGLDLNKVLLRRMGAKISSRLLHYAHVLERGVF